MTKIERADVLLDAIGFIGEDIVAEASGVSSVLQIPSKLKLNLMVMRRLIAAMICLVLVSALTPLSVYLYNNYIHPAIMPPETTEDGTLPSENESEPENSTEAITFSVPDYYAIDCYTSFELISREGKQLKMVNAHILALSHLRDSSRAIYIEIRDYENNTLNDTAIFPGFGMVILDPSSLSTLLILNTELTDKEKMTGYVQLSQYYVNNGELTDIPITEESKAEFDLSSNDALDNSRWGVFTLFQTLTDKIGVPETKSLILDTYTSSSDIINSAEDKVPAPNIFEDRKDGKTTWSIDRIGELFGFVPEVEPIPEYYKTYETEDGWLIKGLTAEPEKYIVVGSTDKIAKEAVVPTFFNGYPIVSIDYGALSNCQAETLTIPKEINDVNTQPCLNSKIKRLIIECGDETKFDAECFVGAPFEEVIFTGSKSEIEYSMFYHCRSLKYVKLPDTLVKINRMAFQSCILLDNLVLPEGLKTIERNAFYFCLSLSEITIPQTVEFLGEYAFFHCNALTSFTILSPIESIPFAAFDGNGCETIRIKEGIKTIANAAIRGDNLKYLYLPSTLTSIVTYFLDSPTSSVEEVYFNGTLEEWSRITTTKTYGEGLNQYTIYCTDGEIQMNKTE